MLPRRPANDDVADGGVFGGSDETDCEGSLDNDDDISSDEDPETRKLDSDVSTHARTHTHTRTHTHNASKLPDGQWSHGRW